MVNSTWYGERKWEEMVVVQHFDGHLIWWAGSSGPGWTDGAEKGKEAVGEAVGKARRLGKRKLKRRGEKGPR